MRNYKGLVIPNRYERDNTNIELKQENYCKKTNCTPLNIRFTSCSKCLFSLQNIKTFEEWYLSKNKSKDAVKK